MAPALRDIDRKRLRGALLRHLEDFPRQLSVLRFSFEQFDLRGFEAAYTSRDPELYMPVQAIERGFGQLQNYIAELAVSSVRLAELPARPNSGSEPKAQPAFEALRDAKVVTATLCRAAIASQRSRNLLEHDYVRVPAGDVYVAVERLLAVAPQFLERFTNWIEPWLVDPGDLQRSR